MDIKQFWTCPPITVLIISCFIWRRTAVYWYSFVYWYFCNSPLCSTSVNCCLSNRATSRSVDDSLCRMDACAQGSSQKSSARKAAVFGSIERMLNMLTPKKKGSLVEGPRKVKVKISLQNVFFKKLFCCRHWRILWSCKIYVLLGGGSNKYLHLGHIDTLELFIVTSKSARISVLSLL